MSTYDAGQSDPKEQLYHHLLQCVQTETPSQLIERFQQLFIEGSGYCDPSIWIALGKITSAKAAEHEFKFVLNRCCHILINSWQMQPRMYAAVAELIHSFEKVPTIVARSHTTKRIRELVALFTQTEQYLLLRRLAQVIDQTAATRLAEDAPLGSLIRRYPYLYQHCLLADDSLEEQQQMVRQVQAQVQRQFEFDLSRYVTDQLRRSQFAREGVAIPPRFQVANNPTLLSDRDLNIALKQFVGKVQGPHTHRDLAQQFLKYSAHTCSYKVFKGDLYEYLTSSVDPEYGKRQFNQRLYTQLQNTLPHSESQKVDELLLMRTCSKLLNFLVTESPQRPDHFIFLDLISNVGATNTVGLLLKIVLLCGKIKPYLEKRFSILFKHYESYTRDGVKWLVESLENLNIALSTNFGAMSLLCFK